MKTQNGTSRSNSVADPLSTMCPRASARSASSASSRVLPIPGAPTISTAPAFRVASWSSASSSRRSSETRPTKCVASSWMVPRRDYTRARRPKRGMRTRARALVPGHALMSQADAPPGCVRSLKRAAPATPSRGTTAALSASARAPRRGVRCHLRRVQRPRQPVAPPAHDRLVPVRRACHLVGRGRFGRGRRVAPPAVLRRAAHGCDRDLRCPHPLSRGARSQGCALMFAPLIGERVRTTAATPTRRTETHAPPPPSEARRAPNTFRGSGAASRRREHQGALDAPARPAVPCAADGHPRHLGGQCRPARHGQQP